MKASWIIFTGAAALALIAGGTLVGAAVASGPVDAGGVIHGCYTTKATAGGAHTVLLQDTGTRCTSGRTAISWNQAGPAGPAGPSGVTSMNQYQLDGAAAVPGGWAFLGSPPEESFTDSNIAAQVTATAYQGQLSEDGGTGYLGICYEPAGGGALTEVSLMRVSVYNNEPFLDITVTGIVGNLAPGKYYVGLCAEQQNGIVNSGAAVTIIMAETASGVTYGTRQGGRTRVRPVWFRW